MFRGEETEGVSVLPTNGIRQYFIPADGVLKIKEKLPTYEWHSSSARRNSGVSIPVDHPPVVISHETIALRSVGSVGDKEAWFVVGTYGDAAKAQEKMRGFKWPSK